MPSFWSTLPLFIAVVISFFCPEDGHVGQNLGICNFINKKVVTQRNIMKVQPTTWSMILLLYINCLYFPIKIKEMLSNMRYYVRLIRVSLWTIFKLCFRPFWSILTKTSGRHACSLKCNCASNSKIHLWNLNRVSHNRSIELSNLRRTFILRCFYASMMTISWIKLCINCTINTHYYFTFVHFSLS